MILNDDAPLTQRPGATSGGVATVWFVRTVAGEPQLFAVKRKFQGRRLESSLQELINGPTDAELKDGVGSEIPRGTVLLGVHREGGAVEVDLSKRFAGGGGISSLETRLEQVARTLKDAETKNDVFLGVEGKRLALLGGEGVEVKQPINK
mgnify:CR=1 FL=1